MSFYVLSYCKHCENTAAYYFLHMLSRAVKSPTFSKMLPPHLEIAEKFI